MTPGRNGSAAISPWKVGVGVLIAIGAALYVSGYFFLWAIHARPYDASALTILRYRHYYGVAAG